MSGGGNSKSEALEKLRKSLDWRKAENKKLPRPGTGLPIEFASRIRIDRHAELAEDFTKRVLGLEWAWISDQSSLWDFHVDEDHQVLVRRVR
jgi:hypothetical protein